jgi:hypothetical protein
MRRKAQKKYTPEACKDVSTEWRVGKIWFYSPVFEQWVDRLQSITIKPNESVRKIEKSLGVGYRLETPLD